MSPRLEPATRSALWSLALLLVAWVAIAAGIFPLLGYSPAPQTDAQWRMVLWQRTIVPTSSWSAAAAVGLFVLFVQGRRAMAEDAMDCVPRSVAILMSIAVVLAAAYFLLALWF